MILALTVLEIVAPVFLLACIGFVWVKLGFAYAYPITFVTQMAMNLAIPCLIFVSLMQTKIDPAALTTLSLASVVAYLALSFVMILLVAAVGLNRRTYAAPMIFGNTGNIGLPLALFAYGDAGLGYAVVVFAIMAIWSFTFGIWLVAGKGAFGKVLREPLVWATLLGGVFLWQGWETPAFATNTLSLVGQMGIPMMLITLGVAVARLSPGGVARAIWLSAAKIVICVATAWVIGRWFALDHVAFGVLVLQVATPVAVSNYLLAEKYDADAQAVAGLVVVSTLMAVGALPLLLAALI